MVAQYLQLDTDITNILVGVKRSSGNGVFVTTNGNTAAFNRAGPNDNFQFYNMRVTGRGEPVEEGDAACLSRLAAELDAEELKTASAESA